MGTYATSTDVSDLRSALTGFVSAISHTNTNAQTILQKQAQLALDKYADAQLAIINLGASAASSYSSGVGISVTKRSLAEVQAAADAAWSDFVRACEMGGVTVPSMDDAVAYWDLSGVSND